MEAMAGMMAGVNQTLLHKMRKMKKMLRVSAKKPCRTRRPPRCQLLWLTATQPRASASVSPPTIPMRAASPGWRNFTLRHYPVAELLDIPHEFWLLRITRFLRALSCARAAWGHLTTSGAVTFGLRPFSYGCMAIVAGVVAWTAGRRDMGRFSTVAPFARGRCHGEGQGRS
jgi:hypothetical protein